MPEGSVTPGGAVGSVLVVDAITDAILAQPAVGGLPHDPQVVR